MEVGRRELHSTCSTNSEDRDTASEKESIFSDRARRRRRYHEGQQRRGGCSCRYRWINSKGGLMVLVWNLLVFSYQYEIAEDIFRLMPGYNGWEPWVKMSAALGVGISLPLLLYPLAGWLADTKLGRYKVMKISLWIMWGASITLLIYLLLKYNYTYKNVSEDRRNVLLIPVAVVYCMNVIGLAGFQANIIPFGIDQMEHGSAEQYISFIHWYYWTRNFSFGLLLSYVLYSDTDPCFDPDHPYAAARIDMVVLVVQVALLSLALILDFCFSSVLVKEPKTLNPLRTVYNISVFVVRHSQPVGQRSAMTYERGYYTRTDLATIPYGGPFQIEDVESVKTFWRMIVFLTITSFAIIPLYTVNQTMTYLIGPHLDDQSCPMHYLILTVLNAIIFVLAIPVNELMYPIIHKYIFPMVHRVMIGYILGLLTVVAAVSVNSFGRGKSFTCIFYHSKDSFDIANWMLSLPIVASTLAEMFIFIPAYEFICAQSPYNMRGLLIGCFYALQGVAGTLSSIMLLIFAKGYSGHKEWKTMLGCDFWFGTAVFVVTLAGLAAYSVVARWYKNRERDYLGREYANQREILEAYYEK